MNYSGEVLPGVDAVLSCPPLSEAFRGAVVAAAAAAGANEAGRSVDGAASGDTRNLCPASHRAENGLASCFRSGSTRMAFLQRNKTERKLDDGESLWRGVK